MNKDSNAIYTTPEAARAVEEYLLMAGRKAQKEVEDLKRPEIITIGQDTYVSISGQLKLVKPTQPDEIVKPNALETYSLDGLNDFIKEDVDGFFKDPDVKYIVRVASPTRVEAISPVTGYWKEHIIVARCTALVPEFDFGKFMDQETFQIKVQTCFEESANRAKVLEVVGNMRKEQSMRTADDGVSQKITVNAGVVRAAEVTIVNPVALTPFRTFREVEQPESPFVLRINEDAEAALFTGDGSAWKLEAVARIGEYLRSNLAGCNVKVIA